MNKNIFGSLPGGLIPPTDTLNLAGGKAYKRTPAEALAQLAVTGCFGDTFYASAETQLDEVLQIAAQCDPEWVAKCAIYARANGQMKDMPAVLIATLAKRDLPLLKRTFFTVVNNGKMLRNFVQGIRSGVTGRKSFGTATKKLLQQWFERRSDASLFHASIGESPSLADIIKMIHPKPKDAARSATLAYLMGKPCEHSLLPQVVQDFEAAKLGAGEMPDINFQFLSSLPLSTAQWASICKRASWQTLRMNLNTFNRHGVFADNEVLSHAIMRLRNPVEIKEARPMPYQMMSAFMHADPTLPPGILMALADAVQISLSNVPALPVNTVIGVDVSGSMANALTGRRGTATGKVRCVDVAALFACAILRSTPTARVCAFDTTAHSGQLGGSIVEAAKQLAAFGGGGTDCSIPLVQACGLSKVDAVVIISDNESWFTSSHATLGRYSGTPSMQAWRQLQARNPGVKLVNIDITPNTTRQTVVEPNVLQVGGFSDAVFDVIAQFLTQNKSWLEIIQAVDIPPATATLPA